MPEPLVRIAAALLGLTFAWAALAKLVRWDSWRRALTAYELPPGVARVAAFGAPLLEVVAAVFVLSGLTKVGGALTLVLLAGFSGALLHAQQHRGDRLPCGCFGRATERDYRLMLGRNALLGVLAAVLLLARGDVWFAADLSAPSAGDAVPVLLVVAGLALSLWLVRQTLGSFERKRTH
jgi:uncharacterized membrane protein YphA (DoxX/SURF4 family)